MIKLLMAGIMVLVMVGCASTQSRQKASIDESDVILKRVVEADLSDGLVIQNMELGK